MNKVPVFDHRNDFHKAAPKRLIKALEQAGSERKLSRILGVNILYVSQLLRSGIEPTDKTEKGRETRVKLYLTKRKKQIRVAKPEEWCGQKQVKKAIRGMVKATKNALKVNDGKN
jgi:hypothetical protein